MPFGELRSGGGGGCDRCGRCCKKGETRALRCLCALSFLGLFVLALPVLYLLRAKAAEKAAPEEILMEAMPTAQKQHGNPPCHNCDFTIRPSVHARVSFNVSQTKCVEETPEGTNLLWDIVSQKGQFQLDEEHISFTIPKDGRYLVYSQVTFSCAWCSCKENVCCGEKSKAPKTVWQQIMYKMLGYEKPRSLFISVGSINETKSLKSLYLAAVMLFKKGEKLMVEVSNLSLVETETRYTFFGAYFIS